MYGVSAVFLKIGGSSLVSILAAPQNRGMTKHLLSFGHGYSARAVTPLLLDQGWEVAGTTRSAEKTHEISASGVQPVIWPGDDLSNVLEQADALLISTGPTADGCPVLNDQAKAIAEHAPHLKWVGYLSTTGVYGDHQGGWVDEDTSLTPTTRRGEWRKAAEEAWQDLASNCDLPLHIFRLAGIYGPGRGPFAKVRAGTARRIIKKNQVFSRIHVEDIAQVLIASLHKPDPGRIYNVCDDEAAPPQDVLTEAARMLGMDLPPEEDYETAEMTPMARSFYAESKRVRNDRIKSELGVTLKYPSYRTGLRALLD